MLVYGIPRLCANKRSKKGSGVAVDIPGREVSRLEDVQRTSIISCETKWLQFSGA